MELGEWDIILGVGFDIRIMELGEWDIILGVDWMYYYSPITLDFH